MKTRTYLLDALRTPIGSHEGALAEFGATELFEIVLRQLLRRLDQKVPGATVAEFIASQAFMNGLEPNIARLAWLKAGGSETTPAASLQMQCGGGMKAIHLGMNAIACGADLVIAGGGDSMSCPPYLAPSSLRRKSGLNRLLSKWIPKIGPRLHVGLVDDGLAPLALIKDETTVAMARTAERLARQFGISRQRMDEFSLVSQRRAAVCLASRRFKEEIVPVLTRRGAVYNDQHPRATSIEKLAKLKPVLGTEMITAGNASGIADGAGLVAIASHKLVDRYGLDPLGVLVDGITVGLDPKVMGLGPVFAVNQLLARNGLCVADIDLWELNEAFAAQALVCMDQLGLDLEIVNVNGGAIAYGHPIAMTGARLPVTLARELKARGLKRGVATACVGGGMGVAMIVESI